MQQLHFVELQGVDIFQQLELEEALLRSDDRNFCIINKGSSKAIVMGISGNPQHLLDVPRVIQDKIPVIKRFSGGGTVVVDDQTLFVTFIFSKNVLPVEFFPEPIMKWSADVYANAWEIPDFSLRENDYVIGNRKCGGNAQYIQKNRFLHHTSFLWDFNSENMQYLQLPVKRPKYRLDRSHSDFLCRLKDYSFSSVNELIDRLKNELVKRFYINSFDIESFQVKEHRKALTRIFL